MKLEEAIENTKKRIKSWENIAEIGKATLSKEEYENSQKICEEQKQLVEKIEHLQKENEKLKNIDLTVVYLKGVFDEREKWQNKIREKIEKHRRDLYSNVERYVADELESLLKEE